MSNGTQPEIVEAPEGWRIAIRAFDEAGFTYGQEIPKSWFFDAFGIIEPQPQTSLKQAQDANLKFLACFKEFELYLLQERSMALQTQWGKGYRIVTPGEQTEWAETEFEREMKKSFSRAVGRLVNTDHKQLTTAQSKENAEALARAGATRSLLTGKNKITTETVRRLISHEDA